MPKTLVQTLLAAFCAILHAAPLEGGGVMLIGMRNAMFGGGWRNPYVTDGLIAMWDGEWNAGPGVHDPNATVWEDLVGDKNLTLENGCVVNSDNMLFSNGKSCGAVSDGLIDGVVACEIVLGIEEPIVSYNNIGAGVVLSNGDMLSNSTFNGLVVETRNTSSRPMGYQIGQVLIAITNVLGVHSIYWAKSPSQRVFYSDGSAVPLTSYNNNWNNGSNGFAIGRRAFDSQYWIKNKVYTVRLYSRALSADEIAANYAVDKARFNLPDAT